MLSGEEMGIGKALPYFLPAHPAFPVPPSTAGAVNHSQSFPTKWPSPPRLPPAFCLQATLGLCGQPQGWGLGDTWQVAGTP